MNAAGFLHSIGRDSIGRDLRYALRAMRRSPSFTVVAAVTLALGIGATTAIFTVVNAVLIQPLRYPEPDALILVSHTAVFQGLAIDSFSLNSQMYVAYLDHNQTFQEFGVWTTGSANLVALGRPERVQTVEVTQGVLPALGVQPALGRWFSQADDSPGTPETVMLTDGYWRRRFGEDRRVVGRVVTIDSRPREVIGVMPASFRFPDLEPDVILPKRIDRSRLSFAGFGNRGLARLAPGVTVAQANADIARLLPIWLESLGEVRKAMEALRIGPAARPLKQFVVGDVGKVLWVVMGTVGMVLLIACANVANLVLVRAQGRQRELAIRTALGAGWIRIARELLVQSLVLGLAGGVLGLAFAAAALRLLVMLAPANLPRLAEIAIDPAALGFALAMSLLSGLLFGLVPMMKRAPQIATLLRAGGRSGTHSREQRRSQNTLVVVQVALALVLLVASGLMIRSIQAMRHIEPGFVQPEHVQTVRVGIPETEVSDPDRLLQLQREMVDRLAAIGGVMSVSFTTALPMETEPEFESSTTVFVEGVTLKRGETTPLRRIKWVSPQSFATVGTPLVAGRDLTWIDLYESRDVVIVSQNMARETWGSAPAALGKRVRESQSSPWREVVGVAGDVYDDGAHQRPPAIVYLPARGQPSVAYALRTGRAGTASLVREIQQAVAQVNPNLPIARVRTLDEFYRRSMARTSFTLVMLAVAGAMALLLGVIGIYGVLAYTVASRRPEVGIRVALGAPPWAVKRMFIRHGLVLCGAGVALGLVAASGLSRLMSSLVFGVTPQDPATYAATGIVLLLAATLASYIPASRAAAVDPMEALRAE